MTVILDASALTQVLAMAVLVGLAIFSSLTWRAIWFSPVRQRVIADRRQLRTQVDVAAVSATDERLRRN